jgi:thiamine kinase-like enzyme
MKKTEVIKLFESIIKEKVKSIDLLPTGLTNHDYLIKTQVKQYIIRIPKPINKELFNYGNEGHILKLVKRLEIDVNNLYFNPKTGIKISAFITNLTSYSNTNLSDPLKVRAVANTLLKLHQIKLNKKIIFNPFKKLKLYQKLVNKRLYENEDEIITACKRLFDKDKLVLCHNDLVDGNILFKNKRLYIIDYEYAGLNNRSFDLASFLSENNIEDLTLIKTFTKTYFKNIYNNKKLNEVLLWYKFNDLLWSYWAYMMWQKDKKPIFKDIYFKKSKRFKTIKKGIND